MPTSIADLTVKIDDEMTEHIDPYDRMPREVLWTYEFPFGGSLSIVRYEMGSKPVTMLRVIDRHRFQPGRPSTLYVTLESGWVEGFIGAVQRLHAESPAELVGMVD